MPTAYPLRTIRAIIDEALDVMSGDFEIPPENLRRALLLQARSERQLMEQLDDNLLFRWFAGVAMDAQVWDASTFSKNRDRRLAGDIAQRLLAVMSDEHFSVDGTPTQAWASHKSFQPQSVEDEPSAPGRSADRLSVRVAIAERRWRGQKRSDQTHASTTDPQARLARKLDGTSSILADAGHMPMQNRNRPVSGVCLNHASGTAERDAARVPRDERPGGPHPKSQPPRKNKAKSRMQGPPALAGSRAEPSPRFSSSLSGRRADLERSRDTDRVRSPGVGTMATAAAPDRADRASRTRPPPPHAPGAAPATAPGCGTAFPGPPP